MKKHVISLIIVLIMSLNSVTAMAEKSTEVKEPSKDRYDMFYNDSQFQEITDYSDPDLYTEDKTGNIKVFYREIKKSDSSIVRYGEWFKPISGRLVNYKQSVEKGYHLKKELFIFESKSAEFYVDNSKCKNNSGYINNNCQSKNKKIIEDIPRYAVTSMFNASYSRIVIDYANTPNQKSSTFTRYRTFAGDEKNDLLKTTDIIIKRDKNNKITHLKFDDGNSIIESVIPDPKSDLYDYQNFKTFRIKQTNKDDEKRIIDEEISTTLLNDKKITLQSKSFKYYSNSKVKFSKIEKRNLSDKKIYYRIDKLNNKGLKKQRVYYSFKRGKTTLRREYVYNSKGNLRGKAYRYTTTYKKGKRVKTYRQAYSKKGKLQQKKKVKHRKDFY